MQSHSVNAAHAIYCHIGVQIAHANTETGVCMECVTFAIGAPLWRQTVDSTAPSCTVFETVRNDAVEST
eukprot:11162943-Lingulodinium_polyedra.AAC.1